METPKEYYYTYYSYEEWGRGYFGSRGCKCLPEEDINYFGSFYDKTFKPTQKIILKSDYATREEAYADEIILQQYYKVAENPHFANRAYQTSTKFYVSKEQAKKGDKTRKKLGLGLYALTEEQLNQRCKKSLETRKKLGLGIFGFTTDYQKKKELKMLKMLENWVERLLEIKNGCVKKLVSFLMLVDYQNIKKQKVLILLKELEYHKDT